MKAELLRILAQAPAELKKRAFIETCRHEGYLAPMEITLPDLVDLYLKLIDWAPDMIMICQGV